MCIFTLPVESVSNTRIAVGAINASLQLTVYQNETVTATPGVAMVLPVPNSVPVNMVDLSSKENWSWSQIEHTFFPMPLSNAGGFSFGAATWSSKSSGPLPVTKCGGYQVSFAPTLLDLKRIDATVFTLPVDIEQVLQQHYGQGFGFVVCVFQQGETKGHPIAYTHGLASGGRLFIPTRHEHGQVQPATTVTESTVHLNVHCDGCGIEPIVGSRWKCMTCPNFDFCNTCFTANKDNHRYKHFFAQLEKLESAYQTMHVAKPMSAELDFDHTLYLINAVLLASPFTFTDEKIASPESIERNQKATCLAKYFPKLVTVHRVEIKPRGKFGFGTWQSSGGGSRVGARIENDDYYAMPIWK